MSTGAPKGRRALGETLSAEGNIASRHLAALGGAGAERLVNEFPLRDLRPSPKNPRRVSLDNAGVTEESVLSLALKSAEESYEQWLDRCDAFLDQLPGETKEEAEAKKVWSDLFDLARSILKRGLLQPIVATTDGEIVGGERRWTAYLLGGHSHGKVILHAMSEEQANVFRLLENVQRSDLTIPELIQAIRQIVATTHAHPCGIDNPVEMKQLQELFNVRKTMSAYYRAFIRLPDDDPVLRDIMAGSYTSLKQAYESAAERLRGLEGASSGPKQNEVMSTPTGSGPAPKNRSTTSSYPSFKARIPGTEGGVRFLEALTVLGGLPGEVEKKLQSVRESWPAAPDKARQKLLAELLSEVFSVYDGLDGEDDANNGSGDAQ